jgi:hypothetical protein
MLRRRLAGAQSRCFTAEAADAADAAGAAGAAERPSAKARGPATTIKQDRAEQEQ